MVIMAASQAVDPGSIPGCRNKWGAVKVTRLLILFTGVLLSSAVSNTHSIPFLLTQRFSVLG